jgi:hypothetical protein
MTVREVLIDTMYRFPIGDDSYGNLRDVLNTLSQDALNTPVPDAVTTPEAGDITK